MKRSVWLRAVLALFWLTAVVGAYYAFHKPLDAGNALAVVRAAGSLLTAFAVLSLFGGLGARLASLPAAHPFERLALQAALGIGLGSVLLLAWGSLLGVGLLSLAALCALGAALLWGAIRAWWAEWAALPALWQGNGSFGRLLASLTGALLLSTLPLALAPPHKFDALVYHLTLPLYYLKTGRIVYWPGNIFWGQPQVGHLSYLLAMRFGGTLAATAFGWLVGLVALLGLWGCVARPLGPRVAWVAVAALLGGYSLAASLAWGYVDWHTVLFGWAALAALLFWLEERKPKGLLLAGALAGFAVGVKYTAGVVLLGGAALILMERRVHRWADLLRYLAAAALAVFPYLLKNFLATGNPLYPFGFPAGEMSSVRLGLYQGQPIEGNLWDLFLLPLRATLFGVENATLTGWPGYNSSLGPLLLGLAPLALLWRGNDDHWGRVRTVGLFALPGLLAWGVGSRLSGHLLRTHLYFALFPAFAILAGYGFAALERLRLPGVRLGRLGGALILLVMTLNLFQVGRETLERRAGDVLLGLRSPQAYQDDNLGWYAPAMRAVRALPDSSSVLLLWEARSFDCLPKCDPDETLDRWLDDLRSLGSAGAVARAWREQGFTHLLFYNLGADFVRASDARYAPEEWAALDDLLASLPVVEAFGEAYTLYTLERAP